MTKPEFLTMFEEIIQADPGTLTGAERLTDLENWDSMSVVVFLAQADVDYSVSLSREGILLCTTVDDLSELLESRIHA